MAKQSPPLNSYVAESSRYPRQNRRLRWAEVLFQVLGVSATVLQRGLDEVTALVYWELGAVVLLAMLGLTASLWLRFRWSLTRTSFLRENRGAILVSSVWLAGVVLILLVGPFWLMFAAAEVPRWEAVLIWSQVAIAARAAIGFILAVQWATGGGRNPAVLLVSSFALAIVVGTLLLMLPRARAETDTGEARAPFLVALFTATSATCVTGLVVVDTGTYWSRGGQIVILCLFQLGGVGIMTFGAFFAIAARKQMAIRESATLRDLLESERVGDVRRVVLAVLLFTLISEAIGAVLLSGLWSGRPLGEQAFFSLFHAVSGFCNAGFALTEDSFVGFETRWQVWGVLAGLIILGGTGFVVLYNVFVVFRSRYEVLKRPPLYNLSRHRARLTLNSKVVLTTTATLLIAGAVSVFFLEAMGEEPRGRFVERVANAWFQSVTFRTAGFHTVDHGELMPASKLFAVLLMFIGASPGSTGGGIKTACIAVTVLALVSILRGHERVEIFGRTIPHIVVQRALIILSLGMVVVMTTTLLLTIFEDRPALFLNHLFESVSAFGTVGASTGITPDLTTASKWALIVTMFLGRVGPLTLLIALVGQEKGVHYEYPEERVTLG